MLLYIAVRLTSVIAVPAEIIMSMLCIALRRKVIIFSSLLMRREIKVKVSVFI